MKIKVEPFLMKRGNRIAKAAIEFSETDGILAGFHLVGFTVCEDAERGIFIMFPSAITQREDGTNRPFFFLRPNGDDLLSKLSDEILDVYDSMTGVSTRGSDSKASIRK